MHTESELKRQLKSANFDVQQFSRLVSKQCDIIERYKVAIKEYENGIKKFLET